MLILFVIGEFFVAILLATLSWLYWTDAERYRSQNVAAAERMPKLLHFLSPPSLLRGRFGLWQVRIMAVAAALMSLVLLVAAAAALTHH
jgi:hypothetical protein